MRKLLLIIGLAGILAACKHESKPQSATQSQSTIAPVLDQAGHQIGQAFSPAPAATPVNSPPTSPVAMSHLPAPQTTNPATSNGPTQPAPDPPRKPSAFQPAPVPVPSPPIAIPAGTLVRVRLEQTIDTKRNRAGDRFEATLISPIRVNGNLAIPHGTTFEGHVTEAKASGRFKGRAVLGVELDSFRLNGVEYRVVTASRTRVSGRHRKRNWILMGGGSALGATLGAVAGGGAGALIGAGAGAGAGTVAAFFTGRKNVSLRVETPLTFQLRTDIVLSGERRG
ncbi:MAG TPA: hypothetical protein VGP62_29765 [Bryobacteraceae bacterium]|jgi:hypothetical protein|nr:hypothetical protein [Bryobacteraceae bacterium]